MKLIHSDFKHGVVKLSIDNVDDLWSLYEFIESGDLVKGKTFRKIKVGEESDVSKRSVFLEINVEKIDFSDDSRALRIAGKITQAPDDVPRGSYHTFSVEENSVISIAKKKWLDYQIDRLKESCKERHSNILICVFDREESLFALMKNQGYTILSKIKGVVEKKKFSEKINKSFYVDILNLLKSYDEKQNFDSIIVASSPFWVDEFQKHVKDFDIKEKLVFASCSSVDEAGINEVIKRPETKQALKDNRTAREIALVEEVISEISKNGKVTYGFDHVRSASELGAVEFLLITNNLIKKFREENNFSKLESIMRSCETSRGKIIIVNSSNDAGKKLDGISGIASLLRFQLEY